MATKEFPFVRHSRASRFPYWPCLPNLPPRVTKLRWGGDVSRRRGLLCNFALKTELDTGRSNLKVKKRIYVTNQFFAFAIWVLQVCLHATKHT